MGNQTDQLVTICARHDTPGHHAHGRPPRYIRGLWYNAWMKPAKDSVTQSTALSKVESANLYKWLKQHAEAIDGLCDRLLDKQLNERDAARFYAGWARNSLNELLYVVGSKAGIVTKHWLDK